jgi:hypothetical protein
MADNPLEIIRILAKQFKGRISSTNVYDANVCTSTHPPDKSWVSILVAGEPFSKELRYTHRNHKVRMFANQFFLEAEVISPLPIEPLSVNQKNANDPLLEAAPILTIGNQQYSSFTRSGRFSIAHMDLIAQIELTTLERELGLQANESLHFAPDAIRVYLDSPSLSRTTGAIEGMISLAERIERAEEEIDLSILPVQFHPLISLVKKWAIGDDSDRDDFLANLPKSALKAFVNEMEPYLNAIDSYLDSFGSQPPSMEAAMLGRLAECAIEAKRHLANNQ